MWHRDQLGDCNVSGQLSSSSDGLCLELVNQRGCREVLDAGQGRVETLVPTGTYVRGEMATKPTLMFRKETRDEADLRKSRANSDVICSQVGSKLTVQLGSLDCSNEHGIQFTALSTNCLLD